MKPGYRDNICRRVGRAATTIKFLLLYLCYCESVPWVSYLCLVLKVTASDFNPLTDVGIGRDKSARCGPTTYLGSEGSNHTAENL